MVLHLCQDEYFFLTCYFLIAEKFEAAKSEVVDEFCICCFLCLQWSKDGTEDLYCALVKCDFPCLYNECIVRDGLSSYYMRVLVSCI